MHKHNFEKKITKSPGFIKHNKLLYDSPLEHITYDKAWYDLTKISLLNLLYTPLPILNIIRFFSNVKIFAIKFQK